MPVIGEIGAGMPGEYMTYDQRFAAQRPDVLVYQTEPLDQDVTIVGPVIPVLQVSTTGTDSDFIVKLIDVYPNDYPDPTPNPKGVHMGAISKWFVESRFAESSATASRSRKHSTRCRMYATLFGQDIAS